MSFLGKVPRVHTVEDSTRKWKWAAGAAGLGKMLVTQAALVADRSLEG